MKSASSTEEVDWIRAAGVIACILAIVMVFYMPSWWILPNADPLSRWGVWISGYIGGVVVITFSRWIK